MAFHLEDLVSENQLQNLRDLCDPKHKLHSVFLYLVKQQYC